LKSGSNIFLTGSAGTGKTFLLNKFIKYLIWFVGILLIFFGFYISKLYALSDIST